MRKAQNYQAKRQKEKQQEQFRQQVIEEQTLRDPIVGYVNQLRIEYDKVSDPFSHENIWGSNDEWSNIPKLVAKLCIHTQAHLHALMAYIHSRKDEETTASLRDYVESEN